MKIKLMKPYIIEGHYFKAGDEIEIEFMDNDSGEVVFEADLNIENNPTEPTVDFNLIDNSSKLKMTELDGLEI